MVRPLALILPAIALCGCVVESRIVGPAWTVQSPEPGLAVSCPVPLKPAHELPIDPDEAFDRDYQGDLGSYNFELTVFAPKDSAWKPAGEELTLLAMGIRDGAKPDDQSVSTGERDLLLSGWPGIELEGKREDGTAYSARVFLVGNRVVRVICQYPSASKGTAVDEFIDSLQITPHGSTIVAGPDLRRFPLGDSGFSALFPRKPDTSSAPFGSGSSAILMHTFLADYAIRNFLVDYGKVSPKLVGSPAAASRLVSALTSRGMKELGTHPVAQNWIMKDGAQVLRTEFSSDVGYTGVTLAWIRTRTLFIAEVSGPEPYKDERAVNTFLNSVQDKK